jgi:PAS domain S-box-containing protein
MELYNRDKGNSALDSENQDSLRFERLVQRSPQGMHFYSLDSSGKLIFKHGNDSADRILGIDHNLLKGKTVEEAFPGLEGTDIAERYRNIAIQGGQYTNEQIIYHDNAIAGAFDVNAFQISPGEMVAMFSDITDRIRDREEIKENNNLLGALIESSPNPIYVKELNGRFKLCNEALCNLLAVKREQVIGRFLSEFCSDDQTVELFKGIDEEVKSRGSSIKQDRIIDAQGQSHDIMVSKCGLQNQDGKLSGVVGFLVDITPIKAFELNLKKRNEEYRALNEELQAAEEELRVMNDDLQDLNRKLEDQNESLKTLNNELSLSEEKFRIAFKTSPDSVNLNRLKDGLYIEINDGFTRVTGYTPEDVKDKTSHEIDIWAIPDDRKKLVKALLDKGYCDNLETRFRMKDGRILRCMMSARVLELAGEKVILSISRDIEKLKQSEDALRESEERFRQLAENTNDVFWLRSSDSILYINSAFKRTWGIDPQLVIDKPENLINSIHPDDRDSFQPLIPSNELEQDSPYTEQYRIIKPNGEIRWIWSRIYPVCDNQGKVVRYAGIASDITQQKEIEKELIAAREHAVESDRLKSAFLANISHEIRTPMNGIIGFSELLDNSGLIPEKRKMYVDIIKSSGMQLVRIIDDIIDISKIEANQLALNIGSCALDKLLAELHVMYQKQLQQRNVVNFRIRAACELDSKSTSILVDEARLRQILINLINNSIKFTEVGEVAFGCELAKNEIQFFVSDTGMGIPKELHSVIFKRFRQGSETLSRKFGGTGLGLAISEGLVHLLGGRIWFESEPGRGTVFYFTIPYKPTLNDLSIGYNPEIQVSQGKWVNQQILVAEDDMTNFLYLQNILEPTGAHLLHAKNGEEAVQICRENDNIAVVLMDIRMPILNGYEATRQIRAFRKALPVIAQTAYAMPEDQIKAIQAGCNAYISKPINRHQLLDLIEKNLVTQSGI